MTTKEILEYLEKRWQIVKQVEEAAQNLERIKKQQPSQKNLYKRRMIILASLGIYMILLYFMSFPRMISYGFIGFLFYTILNMVIIAGILYLAYYFWKRKKEIIVQSNADYNDALKRAETDFYSLYNSTEYIQGAKSFPSEYYNSESLARLYKLVEEGRANSLKEAYNLLEQQRNQEITWDKQDKLHSVQQDIARSSRRIADSSEATASNTAETAKNTHKIAKDTEAIRGIAAGIAARTRQIARTTENILDKVSKR